MTKIAIFIPYFGKWPEWYPLFFETLRRNNTIDFIFYTDCDTTVINAPNIQFHKMSFDEYKAHVNSKLNFEFNPASPYKLCDLRPLFGFIHQDVFEGYDFYGWTDMDLLFGDIRSFYTENILQNYDVLSTHNHRISGHLALFRNNEKNRQMYKSIYEWKAALDEPEYVGIDEYGLTNAYFLTIADKFNIKFKTKINNFATKALSRKKKKKLYIEEQYTTPFTPLPWIDGSTFNNQPNTWFYNDGKVTNSINAGREFIYIHFMNFKSSLWRHDGTKAPWEGMEKICTATVADMANGVKIDLSGISKM